MATHKKNPTNWSTPPGTVRAGKLRRGEEPEVSNPAGRKKDTKKWCKGKVGRKHDYPVDINGFRQPCSKCNRNPW